MLINCLLYFTWLSLTRLTPWVQVDCGELGNGTEARRSCYQEVEDSVSKKQSSSQVVELLLELSCHQDIIEVEVVLVGTELVVMVVSSTTRM